MPNIRLIGSLAEKLKRNALVMCTAESCTGGIIAAACTSLPGSSAWFAGGIVSYTNDMKHRLLKVPQVTLEQHGAVSEAVAGQMALGALEACKADCSIAVSGIAGPDGGSPQKPVGTVCLAVAVPASLPQGAPSHRHNMEETSLRRVYRLTRHFDGDRQAVREQAARFGLNMLDEILG